MFRNDLYTHRKKTDGSISKEKQNDLAAMGRNNILSPFCC